MKKKTTWVDVYPILAGQCLHCHGAKYAEKGGDGNNSRFDFFKPKCDPALVASSTVVTEKTEIIIKSWAVLDREASILDRAPMPPAPAPALEDWEVDTIDHWDGSRGTKPSGNKGPKFEITGQKKDGDDLVITYFITDPDGDPVLGELSYGTTGAETEPIQHSGSGTFTVANALDNFTVTAKLCDGWQTTTDNMDVEK